jgi:hypothetical protein
MTDRLLQLHDAVRDAGSFLEFVRAVAKDRQVGLIICI